MSLRYDTRHKFGPMSMGGSLFGQTLFIVFGKSQKTSFVKSVSILKTGGAVLQNSLQL